MNNWPKLSPFNKKNCPNKTGKASYQVDFQVLKEK